MPLGDILRSDFAIAPLAGFIPTTAVTNRPRDVFSLGVGMDNVGVPFLDEPAVLCPHLCHAFHPHRDGDCVGRVHVRGDFNVSSYAVKFQRGTEFPAYPLRAAHQRGIEAAIGGIHGNVAAAFVKEPQACHVAHIQCRVGHGGDEKAAAEGYKG